MKKLHDRLVALVFFTALAYAPMVVPAMGQGITSAEVAARHVRARAGNAREQFLLGVMYEKGIGVVQDPARAATWYRKAAIQDHVRAQLSLGNLYDKGVGVEQNYTEAFRWYSKAAVLGDAEAMFFLGSIYYNGDGLDKDLAAALVWLQGADERQYRPAKAALAQVRTELAAKGGAGKATTNDRALPPPDIPALPPPVSAPLAWAHAGDLVVSPSLSGFAVQIGSFSSDQKAREYWQELQKGKPDLFAKAQSIIYRKQFESGRIFYRLNAAVFQQKAEANTQCSQFRARGTDCLVVKY